ncbi:MULTISPECIES: toprim domain-containing protein [Bacillus cereus group]|uniref:toprim domain-containing protein n=1 Tax=Bacillus cereus group TaxID=86661 RepID=UPI0022E3C6B7|nr:toprim domain-containing protein [Bacillus cereus group sp. TH152-1LC]MDA1675454.1 toprim domain-containing protein [Bacillus cereus group sp. TH152-1LC]
MGFVVEGFHDELKLLSVYPTAYVVVTKGTRFDKRVVMDVNKAMLNCDKVFLLTDPDDAGDWLAERLSNEFPNLERMMLNPNECLSYRKNKVKVGVEHCSNKYLLSVLSQYLIAG